MTFFSTNGLADNPTQKPKLVEKITSSAAALKKLPEVVKEQEIDPSSALIMTKKFNSSAPHTKLRQQKM